MLLEPGNSKVYEDDQPPGTTLDVYPDGMEGEWTLLRHTAYVDGIVTLNARERLKLDAEGNVWSFGWVEAAFNPISPVLYVKAPLYVGSTWTTVSSYPGYGIIKRIWTCTDQETIEVPFGTYTCFLVEREAHEPDGSIRTGRRWYADGIGRIKEQNDWDDTDFELASAVITAIDDLPSTEPFAQLTITPNPFNPKTEIGFKISRDQHVAISVYDLLGKRVTVLARGYYNAGQHCVPWNGTDSGGRAVPSGTFVIRLETEESVAAKKVLLVR